jgi:glutamate-1-semialdehyde 2,1-aminomutase
LASTLDDPRDALASDALDAALAEAVDHYRARNPHSARWYEQAVDVLPGGNTRSVLYFSPFPLCMERGEGCWLFDIDGHRYLDAVGEFTAGLYGHSHPVIRAAIERALDGGLNLAGHTAIEAELARALRERFGSMELVRFTNSGTEANLMALAAATAHTGRRSIVVFRGGYHGGVLTFAAGASKVNVPHRFVIAPYNDLEATADQIAEHADDLAAILVEPVQGSGGCIPGDAEFLAGLRGLADEHGALLIFDEVMTSRLAPGGAQSRLGLRPDLTTLGKYLGGGASFGAFGGRADVMARFDPRRPDALPHAGTFNNNVLSMAAGLAGLRDVYTRAEAQRLDARGDALRAALNDVFADAGADLQCTGVGSLLNIHPTARPIRRVDDLVGADGRRRDLLFFDLLDRGLYIARRGFIALSLPFGDEHVGELIGAAEDFVERRRDLLGRRP